MPTPHWRSPSDMASTSGRWPGPRSSWPSTCTKPAATRPIDEDQLPRRCRRARRADRRVEADRRPRAAAVDPHRGGDGHRGTLGDVETAVRLLDEATEVATGGGAGFYDAEILRVRAMFEPRSRSRRPPLDRGVRGRRRPGRDGLPAAHRRRPPRARPGAGSATARRGAGGVAADGRPPRAAASPPAPAARRPGGMTAGRRRVAILGGGMAGLAAAWRLSEPGWRDDARVDHRLPARLATGRQGRQQPWRQRADRGARPAHLARVLRERLPAAARGATTSSTVPGARSGRSHRHLARCADPGARRRSVRAPRRPVDARGSASSPPTTRLPGEPGGSGGPMTVAGFVARAVRLLGDFVASLAPQGAVTLSAHPVAPPASSVVARRQRRCRDPPDLAPRVRRPGHAARHRR